MMYGTVGAGWGVAMLLGMLAFWLLFALAIAWVVHVSTRHSPAAWVALRPHTPAEHVLAEWLARGEITREEYEARAAALRSHR